MFMQADEHLYECLITCRSEKKYIWNGVKFVIFTLFRVFFTAYNRTIYLYFWMLSINIRVFAVFDFRQKKPLRFFWFRAHLSPFFFFRGGGGNIPSKPPQTKLNFWLQVVLIVKWIPFKAFEELEFLRWQDLPKVWYFWSKFDCNFPPENGWNQK